MGFPFPYSQLIVTLLLMVSVLTPVVVSAVVRVYWWTALITFVPVFGMQSANLVATELEMPFGDDDNDLALAEFQEEMNLSLMMLIHDQADLLPHTSSEAKLQFGDLEGSIQPARC